MDRGGGRGPGGPSRQGSSLPRTLHSSLLHTRSPEPGVAPTEDAQAPAGGQEEHTPYATSAARSASPAYTHSPPPFERAGSRPLIGPGTGLALPVEHARSRTATPHLYLPPFRASARRTAPALFASPAAASTPTFYTYPPPPPARLPPVRSLDRPPVPASSSPAVAGPSSSQHYQYGRTSQWGLSAQEEFTARTVQRQQWDVSPSNDDGSIGRAYGGAYEASNVLEPERWTQVGRQENLPHGEERSTAAHLSAARSTIHGPSQVGSSSHNDPVYPSAAQQRTPDRQAAAQDFSSFGNLQPFYESPSQQSPHTSEPSLGYVEARESGPSGLVVREPFNYPVTPTRARPRRSRPPASPRSSSRAASTASGGPPGKRTGGSDDDDDEDSPHPRKVPRKTQIACDFCRGRKLKCDGQQPLCGNCRKRRHPCSYAPFPKRRGPGKAPKGQRKTDPSQASGSGQTSQGPAGPSADQGLRPRASVETLPVYTQYPSGTDALLPPPPPPTYAAQSPDVPSQRPVLHSPAAGYPQNYRYPEQPAASSSSLAAQHTPTRAYGGLQLQYPEEPSPPALRSTEMYGRLSPYESPQALQYSQPPVAAGRAQGLWGEEAMMDTDEAYDEGAPPPDAYR